MMTDKPWIERCFPSLCDNVIPIEKYGSLEAFDLPPSPEAAVLTKNTISSINDAARLILDDVPENDGTIAIGLDSEWNVEVSAHGHIEGRQPTAIIQIAYQNQVYILQVCCSLNFLDFYLYNLFNLRSAR